MITKINEFKSMLESVQNLTTEDNAKNIWNTLSLNQKEQYFGDEFDMFFDANDNYLNNVADKFFSTKWEDLNELDRNRIIELISNLDLNEAKEEETDERSNLEDMLYVGDFEI